MKTLAVVDRSLPIEVYPLVDRFLGSLESEATLTWANKAASNAPFAHIALAQNVVWPWLEANKGEPLTVQFIGDLPMPYSGLTINPDGHTDTAGAYAAPGYYVDPSNLWTDLGFNSTSVRSRSNLTGDGKFDQSRLADPRAALGWLNLSRFNARTFGSTLSGIDWVVHCYQRYFERNLAYRTGGWKVKRRLGEGFVQGDGASWVTSIDQNAFSWGRDSAAALQEGPYAVVRDFKSLDSRISQIREPLSVLDLTYSSYQIDYLTQRTTNPLYAASLAVGSLGLGWNLNPLREGPKTTGDLWLATVRKGGYSTVPVLYGDASLVV